MYDWWLKNKLLKCKAVGFVLKNFDFSNKARKIVMIAFGCLVFCVFCNLNIPAEQKNLGLPLIVLTLIIVFVDDNLIFMT